MSSCRHASQPLVLLRARVSDRGLSTPSARLDATALFTAPQRRVRFPAAHFLTAAALAFADAAELASAHVGPLRLPPTVLTASFAVKAALPLWGHTSLCSPKTRWLRARHRAQRAAPTLAHACTVRPWPECM